MTSFPNLPRKKEMKMRKTAAGLLATAILAGGVTAANAATQPNRGQTQINKVLAQLVTNGTITQDQMNKIDSALQTNMPQFNNGQPQVGGQGFGPGNGQKFGKNGFGPMGGGQGFARGPRSLFAPQNSARLAAITSALNMTSAQLQAALTPGKSLADVAGANAQAVIAALVTYDTNQINAQVAAGKINPTNAAKLIANLTKIDTAEVNAKYSTMGFGMGHGWETSTATPAPQQ
jgi:hypothetical protein